MATPYLASQDFLQVGVYGHSGVQKGDPLQKFVPTVFVGLGGSGKQVLMRLRKRFYDRYVVRDPLYAQFVFIDTDAQSFVPSKAEARLYEAVLPSQDEKVECTIAPTKFRDLFKDLKNKVESEYLAWLKPELGKTNPEAVANGAGQYRQFGRLAFFLHYKTIRQTLEHKIDEALAFADANPGTVEGQRIEVVIATSLAGGTGSGMFIDVAYLARDILNASKYNTLSNKHISLICFMPSLWSDQAVSYGRLQQNTYAAMLELEYYGTPRTGDELFLGSDAADAYGGTIFHATWDRRDHDIAGVGWDSCFLIDNVNILAPNAPLAADEVFQMAADYLFLDFEKHKFAIEKRSARSNLVQLKDRWMGTWVRRLRDGSQGRTSGLLRNEDVVYATQNGCTFSSFGLAEIYFDIDKLYQAAGYRLAAQLVRKRWIGTGVHGDAEYKSWVRQDLIDPQASPGQPVPPSFRPEALVRLLLTNKNACWLDELERQIGQIGQADYANGEAVLANMLATHRSALRGGGQGNLGQARQTLADNLDVYKGTPQLLGKLREQLRELAGARFNKQGTATTLQLLQRYQHALTEARERVRALMGPPPAATDDPLARLKEAAMVPFPVKRLALSIEFQRARNVVADELRAAYRAVAAEYVDRLLITLNQYIGMPDKPIPPELKSLGTLHRRYTDAQNLLSNVASQLDERYGLAAHDDAQNLKRKLSLSLGWTDDKYDEKINEALVQNVHVGPDPAVAGKFQWERLEARVFERLRTLRKTELGSINTVDELVSLWLANKETNEAGIERIAELLASACRDVLRGDEHTGGFRLEDEADGNAIDLLVTNLSSNEAELYLDRMIKSSAPYFPTIDNHQIANGFEPAYSNLYGQMAGGHPKSAIHAHEIQRLVKEHAAKHQAGPAGAIPAALPAEQSSIVLVREMAGFPLQLYAHLDNLYKAYLHTSTPTGSNDECHINYNETWMNLPDIRKVEGDTYNEIRSHIQFVLLGMIVGVIEWTDGAFHIGVPDEHGIGRDQVRLGARVHRVIKHACEQPRIREYLKSRWEQWKGKAQAEHWAALYASARKTWQSCQNLINLETGDKQSAPIRNCYSMLLHMAREHLEATEAGKHWMESFSVDNAAADRSRVTQLEATCLRPINGELPVYQVVESGLAVLQREAPERNDQAVAR